MSSQWKKRYQLKQQRRKVPSNRAALEEAKFFRELNTELTERMGSWDGLRHFWSIELTENGCLMRDRACKAEAENAKLRELVLKNWYIALSEREALRAHDIDPDGGTYMAALDDEIATAKDCMRELEIEVD